MRRKCAWCNKTIPAKVHIENACCCPEHHLKHQAGMAPRRRRSWVPTLVEIREQTAAIRATWTPEEEAKRAGVVSWQMPVVSCSQWDDIIQKGG